MSDLQPREEIEELLENPLWKKILIGVMGLFLLGLIVSYLIVSFPTYSILSGKSESIEIEGYVISLGEFSIIFSEEAYSELVELYLNNQEVEISACLIGEKDVNYMITEIVEPEVISQSFNRVSFKPCPSETLIVLHSHPYKRCIASAQDISLLEDLKGRNEDALIMIMCEATRFTIYGHK